MKYTCQKKKVDLGMEAIESARGEEQPNKKDKQRHEHVRNGKLCK